MNRIASAEGVKQVAQVGDPGGQQGIAGGFEALGLGVEVVGVRGNVDTRIAKVRSGEYDAVVLARAGLARIGRLDEVTEVLEGLLDPLLDAL